MENYNDLGVAYMYLKRYDEAIEIFKRILLLDPQNAAVQQFGMSIPSGRLRAIDRISRVDPAAPIRPLPFINLAYYLRPANYPEYQGRGQKASA